MLQMLDMTTLAGYLVPGRVIIETLLDRDVMEIPAILVACHGVFIWGKDSLSAVMNAAYLEDRAYYGQKDNK